MSYYISPRFLNKLSVHITKNYLDLPQVKRPLILGIHGRKGEGKTFQCELVFERMGVEVVHISGGELESPDAGDPARLVRMRYREAAERVRVRGRMAVLMINDLDAGAGRFDRMTQYTVNTQLVNNTLMNIADNPTNVQLPGSYDDQPLPRIPIIATGNDFATLYAPLIRDGRMQKFYWEPSHEDRLGIVGGMYADDGLSEAAVAQLVERFDNQAIDFFGAVRSHIYDEQITRFIESVGIEQVASQVVNARQPPTFSRPNFQLEHLITVGESLLYEQERVRAMALVHEYNQALTPRAVSGSAGYQRDAALLTPPGPNRLSPYLIGHGSDADRDASGSSLWKRSRARRLNQAQHQAASSVDSGSNVADGQGPEKAIGDDIGQLPISTQKTLRTILSVGQRLGIEHVDQRRFRNNSWQCYTTLSHPTEAQAVSQIQSCTNTFANHYVRLVGIDPQSRQRVSETIIHRP